MSSFEYSAAEDLSSSTGGNDSRDSLPDAPQAQAASTPAATPTAASAASPHQTKRILGIIPNFRSVTADEKLPPTTTREKFKLTVEDTFDYSAFVEVGILSGMAEAENSEPQFHQGAAGYGRYYWHSFADNTDGNLWVEFLVPTIAREDPRYYTLGHGGFVKRATYSVSRLFITRNNQGNPTPNFAEIVGNGAAAGIDGLYYPGVDRTWTKTGQRWGLQILIDGLDDLLKEFWPDINAKLFHDKY
jgi:hypothetical protein